MCDDIATAKSRVEFIRENMTNNKKSWYIRMATQAKKITKRSRWILNQFKLQI